MSRTRRALAGGLVFVLQVAVRIGTTIVLARILLRLSDQETLGAYSVVMQLVSYLLLLEFGLSRALGRELAQLGGTATRTNAVGDVLGTGATFLLLIGLGVSLLTLALAHSLTFWFEARADVIDAAQTALLLFAAWMLFRFPLSLFHLMLYARQKVALYAAIGLGADILRAVLSIAAVYAGYGLVGLACALVASEAFTYLVSWYAGRAEWRALPRPTVDRAVLRRLLAIGIPLSVMSLGDRLTFYSQDVLAAWLSGASGAAVIYAMRMPGFTAASIVWRLTESAVPGLNDLRGKGALDALRSAHHRLSSYVLGAGLWLCAGICAFNRPVVEAWVGAELYRADGTTAAVAFFMLIGTFNAVLTHFITVGGRLARYPYVVALAGITAVTLGIVLGREMGLAGVLWGATAANLVTTVFLLRGNAAMLESPLKPMLWQIFATSIRCAGAGVAACAAYALAGAAGFFIPWPVAAAAVLLAGGAGFAGFGLLARDRFALVSWLTRAAPATP